MINYAKDEFMDAVKDLIKDKVPYGSWIIRAIELTNIVTSGPKSAEEEGALDYAWNKRNIIQNTAYQLSQKIQDEQWNIIGAVADEVSKHGAIRMSGKTSLKDEFMYEFKENPDKFLKDYSTMVDKVLKDNKLNPKGYTTSDLKQMEKDVNGYFNLGAKENLNGYKSKGDPDYFFEVGRLNFKPRNNKIEQKSFESYFGKIIKKLRRKWIYEEKYFNIIYIIYSVYFVFDNFK